MFNSRVIFMFKRMLKDPETGEKSFNFGVLLKDGNIKIINAIDKSDHTHWKIDESFEGAQIPGEVFSFSNDPVQFKCNLFLTQIRYPSVEPTDPGQLAKPEQIEYRLYIFSDNLLDVTEIMK